MHESLLPKLMAALRDGAVRDLAWLLCSADLLAAAPGKPVARPCATADEMRQVNAWLADLDEQAELLHRYLAVGQPTRLGRYAERLLAYYLEYGPCMRLITAHLPVRRAGHTLGECDFLLETASGCRWHWELAVKRYLQVGGASAASLADFVGPSLTDRFDRKYERLVNAQLRLTECAEFASLGYRGPWQASGFVKGWLFYPDAEAVPISCEIAVAHPRGFWTTRACWRAWAETRHDAHAWVALSRLEWLAPRRLSGPTPGLSADAMLAHAAQGTEPLLVASLARQGNGDWFETARSFIVPDDWPARARAYAGYPLRGCIEP